MPYKKLLVLEPTPRTTIIPEEALLLVEKGWPAEHCGMMSYITGSYPPVEIVFSSDNALDLQEIYEYTKTIALSTKLLIIEGTTSTVNITANAYQAAPPPTGSSSPLMPLEHAAKAGNEATFREVLHSTDWLEWSSEDYVRVVHLALSVGAHQSARDLAIAGSSVFPESRGLQEMKRVLAPPKEVTSQLPPNETIANNMTWLRRNAERYRGQWVALRNGELLASAANVAKLKQRIKVLSDVFITSIPE